MNSELLYNPARDAPVNLKVHGDVATAFEIIPGRM
jgi:hypothetical protein